MINKVKTLNKKLLFLIILLIFVLLLYLFIPIHEIKEIPIIDIREYNQRIEKNIFQTFNSHKLPDRFKKITEYLRKQNPEYNYYLYDDNEMDKFVKEKYPEYWNSYNSINNDYIVAKSDFFRYLIIYYYGGVYFDIKSGCKKPLRKVIKYDDEMIISSWWIINLPYLEKTPNWFIIARKRHPLLKKIIDEIDLKIKNYNVKKDGSGVIGVWYLTGPRLLEKVFLENKNKFKNQITVYPNLINNNLVYSYLSKNNFDNICCLLYSVTKGYIGYCKHKSNRKSYNELSNPIIKNN